MVQPAAACPVQSARDDRKSAAIADAAARPDPGFVPVTDYALARDLMRSPAIHQGISSDFFAGREPSRIPVIFLDGENHRMRRAQLARFFTPRAIRDRHFAVMERTTAELMGELRRTGRGQLDVMSLRLACDVAAEIVGLTNTDPSAMSGRLRRKFRASNKAKRPGLAGRIGRIEDVLRTLWFFRRDVIPAIRHRRTRDCDDVISYLVREGASDQDVLIECMTYATAGMITTREFIVMVAWHLLGDEALANAYRQGDEAAQMAILEEILRIDPVAAYVYRIAAEDMVTSDGRQVRAGEKFMLDLRRINLDDRMVGECPLALDPDRARRQRMASAWMSFGDGPHRCPGAQVALHETRVFIDALLRVPGIRLAVPPTVGWMEDINGYELHGAIVTCDRAPAH